MPFAQFPDRRTAGRKLAEKLRVMSPARAVIYALPRGGVPIALEIAKALQAPLDLLLVRKIGVPSHPEVAAASVVDGESPDLVLNEDVMRAAGISRSEIDVAARIQLVEIERRRALYMPGRRPIPAAGRTAILVDDGIATGASMRAAIAAVRRRNPLRIIVAAPVASPDTAEDLLAFADEVVVLTSPPWFAGVGSFYSDFHQLEDGEVIALLGEAGKLTAAPETGVPGQ